MYLKTINMGSEMSLLTIGRSVSPIIAFLLHGSAIAALFLVAAASAQEVEKKTEPPAPTQATLVRQANAPVSDLLQIRFQDSYAPEFQGAHGQGNVFSINPIIPVPEFAAFPYTQLLSILIPAAITTPQGVTGFGDLKLLDFVLVSRDPEFVWGVGPVFLIPTATDRTTGQGKWQAGPAAGAAYEWRNLTFGVLAQNPMSFAGENDRSYTNFLILQPFATYQLGAGWFVKTEPSMLFNWRTHGKTLPVNLGVGRVFKIGNQTVNCFVEPFWNASNDGPAPRYGITFGFSLLYPNLYGSQ